MTNYKTNTNPLEATINDLKMFEQTQYCYEYIKENNSNKTDEEIQRHAQIASACFRQASEYYKAAYNVSIYTSPLLFSYALNNILKGTCFLKSFDSNIIEGFSQHGFEINNEDIDENILSSKIKIKEYGAVASLLNLFNNTIPTQKIEINKLLRHIPEISDIYFKTTGVTSFIAEKNKNNGSEYIISGDILAEDINNIMNQIGMSGNINQRDKNCSCYFNMVGKRNLEDGTYSQENIFYKRYLNVPEIFNEEIKDINIAFYCYLLIMSYGMLVRYNAHKWEKFIDRKQSKEATLIELSISNSVINFFYQMHYLLFECYYENDTYNDLDVKKVINDETKTIMNNITKEIKSHNLQFNDHEILPWHENYR